MEDIALVGDGFDDIRLLDAEQVSNILQLPKKSVYELPIEKVRLRERTVRWRAEDVRNFVESRREAA